MGFPEYIDSENEVKHAGKITKETESAYICHLLGNVFPVKGDITRLLSRSSRDDKATVFLPWPSI